MFSPRVKSQNALKEKNAEREREREREREVGGEIPQVNDSS